MGASSSDKRGSVVPTDSTFDSLPDTLARLLPRDADVVAQAPARANLIGEHTDYNDGFVLPVALELRTVVGGYRSQMIRLTSVGRDGDTIVDPRTGDGPMTGWGRYVTAVVRSLLDDGRQLGGLEGVVASDVPVGAGLSSSAALEVALVLALTDPAPELTDIARICRRAENEYVGVGSGIMDPLAAAGSVARAAMLIDCRSLERRTVPIPGGLAILVVDSGERRELASGAYDRRRAECAEAARLLGRASLRDATPALVERGRLPGRLEARARHVVTENVRTLATAEALAADDRVALRQLFAASHASLVRDFEVTTQEVDELVAVAARTPGIVASRMTGGGFGGCTVSLVDADAAPAALHRIVAEYGERTGRQARGWISRAASGALDLAGPSARA